MEQCHQPTALKSDNTKLDAPVPAHQLLATLKNIWHKYTATANDTEAKAQWLQLFLFHFQFVSDKQLQQDDFKSFFSPIPEEICSYFLARVYEIISKSDLYAGRDDYEHEHEHERKHEADADPKGEHDGRDRDRDHECTAIEPGAGGKEKAALPNLHINRHNFAQLVLSAPSDCNKIVALRTFLTHQLGQSLLLFLLKVDIKLIASQKGLCNLCINLFPNCPWDEHQVALQPPLNIFEYVGKLRLYQQSVVGAGIATSTGTGNELSTSTSCCCSCRRSSFADEIIDDFHKFQTATRTSDQIASILICLLTKCIASECETAFSEHSMSSIALNFALECLCLSDECFGSPDNALIIKCGFLALIERCLNNMFGSGDHIHPRHFGTLFMRLATVLHSNWLDVELASGLNQDFQHAINFILHGSIYNFVAIYLSPIVGGSRHNHHRHHRHYHQHQHQHHHHNHHHYYHHSHQNQHHHQYRNEFGEESIASACFDVMRQFFDLKYTVVPYDKELAAETQLLFKSTFKTLLRIIEHLRRFEQTSRHTVTINGNDRGTGTGTRTRTRTAHDHDYSNSNGTDMGHNMGNGLPAKVRRKKSQQSSKAALLGQVHCRNSHSKSSNGSNSICGAHKLSCYFQRSLLNLLPTLPVHLQAYAIRYLMHVGTCCCHYTLATHAACLQVVLHVSSPYQKCLYTFVYHKMLRNIFARPPPHCPLCMAKLKSFEFHAGLLQHYRQLADKLLRTDVAAFVPLSNLLKHLKHIAHLLTNDLAAGILAEILLPAFRHHKARLLELRKCMGIASDEAKSFWRPRTLSRSSSSSINATNTQTVSAPSTPTVCEVTDGRGPRAPMDTERGAGETLDLAECTLKLLQDCLNIFAIYLGDLRLIKAFYNEENITHLEELLIEPELIRGICDLIKIGIDNISFLGDSEQEQIALSRRLITLQLNSSDRAAQLLKQLLARFARATKSARDIFWLDEDAQQQQQQQQQRQSPTQNASLKSSLRPLEILQIAALQWSLNFELLRTSQYFYNEFAKIYSIVVDDDDGDHNRNYHDDEDALQARSTRYHLKHGDKTIIDILKLNQNALSAYLLHAATYGRRQRRSRFAPQRQPDRATSPMPPMPPHHENNAIVCSLGWSSLNAQLSSLHLNVLPSLSLTSLAWPRHSVGIIVSGAATTASIVDHQHAILREDTFGERLRQRAIRRTPLLNNGCVTLFDVAEQMRQWSEWQAAKVLPAGVLGGVAQACGGGYTETKRNRSNIMTIANATATATATTSGHGHGHGHGHGNGNEHESGPVSQHTDGSIIGKIFSVFGSLFGGSRSSSVTDLSIEQRRREAVDEIEIEIEPEFRCFFDVDGEAKKLLLKLFESTMAICIKGYQNEEVEKMQKHLGKLKAIILSHANTNWQQQNDQPNHDNTILQALQTLLRIAELSQSPNEPASIINATEDGSEENASRPLASLNAGKALRHAHMHMPTVTATSTTTAAAVAAATPVLGRPISGESASDADYFATRGGGGGGGGGITHICPCSEIELNDGKVLVGSADAADGGADEPDDGDIIDADADAGVDVDVDDYYLTDDEQGYEADGEVQELSDSEPPLTITGDLWAKYQPISRYRSYILHEGLCQLVVDILIELAELCVANPMAGWIDSLVQLANRLFRIRESLGGPLFLLRGFTPVLRTNDPRLKELQVALLELIVDMNTPETLGTFFSILATRNPPVEVLMPYMEFFCSNAPKKAPSVELEFPIILDGKCVSTSDPRISEEIDRIRNYHLHSQATTPFTRSPLIIPVTHARLWKNDGFTVALWLKTKSALAPGQSHRSCSQLNADDTRSLSEDGLKSHIVSVGTNQAMLSVYVNSSLNLVFEVLRPNGDLNSRTASTSQPPHIEEAVEATSQAATAATNNKSAAAAADSDSLRATSPFRNALKQTKLVFLQSFSSMPLFNGHGTDDGYYEGVPIELKTCQLSHNRWTHLTISVEPQQHRLELSIYIDGLDQHHLSVPFRSLRNLLVRMHSFQLMALGDGISMAKIPPSTTNCTESRSTLDGCALHLSISNVMLFNRKIDAKHAILNLTAMGPDFTELTQCQIASAYPNYGYLNLAKLPTANFGHFGESMRLLKQSRILLYSAQQPDMVMGYDPSVDLDHVPDGHPYGIMLYGELIQNELRSPQTATFLSGGLSSLMYLFARVVELTTCATTQALALKVLLSMALSEAQLYAEFMRNDYMSMISCVIKSERCAKDVELLSTIVNSACSRALIKSNGDIYDNSIASLIYPRLITTILHRYGDWHRSGAEQSHVLDALFHCILALTRDKHPHRDYNMEQLSRSGLLRELLNLCKVYVIASPNPVYISKRAAESFVSIVAVFAGSPPSPSLMDEIMKLLLLLHKPSECYVTDDRTKFYFLLTPKRPSDERNAGTHNLMRVATPFTRSLRRDRTGVPLPQPSQPTQQRQQAASDQDVARQARIEQLRKLNASLRNATYRRTLNEFEALLDQMADCSRLNKNVLRTLHPGAVANWLAKYKRSMHFAHSTAAAMSRYCASASSASASASSSSSAGHLARKMFKSPSLACLNAANQVMAQRISRKRLRLQSSHSGKRMRREERHSADGSLLHTLAKPQLRLFDPDFVESVAASAAAAAQNHGPAGGGGGGGGGGVPETQRRPKSLIKTDFYSTPGIIALQEGLLRLLKDFLCLLPDNAVDEVLKHFVKVEFLLVLANHSSCAVRTAVVRLLAALTKRLTCAELNDYAKSFYPQHLANQLSIHPSDEHVFEACVEWVNGVYGSLDIILNCEVLRIQNRFGLNALLAVAMKTAASPTPDTGERIFRILHKLYFTNADEQALLIEAGLLQCSVKALLNLYARPLHIGNAAVVEQAILDLLTAIGEKVLKSKLGPINIIWDIMNMLSFYQEKQPATVVRSFRAFHAQLQLNWLSLFFEKSSPVPLAASSGTLTRDEWRTRIELLIDRSCQFFTVATESSHNAPSEHEIRLFELLVAHSIATNQRCNFIAWGLQSSPPRDLRAFIVNTLWMATRDDFLPSIICDGKMIKCLLWRCLLQDLNEPIPHLKELCQRLGIDKHDSMWNLESELGRIEDYQSTQSTKQKSMLDKTIFRYEMLAVNCIESSMATTRRVTEPQNAERKLLMNHMKDYDETRNYTRWLEIVRRTTHEGAPWYSKERSENFWELDLTEGPSRVHTRLRRCHLDIDKRFFMEDYRNANNATDSTKATPNVKTHKNTITNGTSNSHQGYVRPLDYLITSYDQQLNISLNAQILYNFPAKFLPVDGEIDGEIIITDNKLYFMATYRCKYFYVSCDILNITEIWVKRYQHEEKAFEIFLDSNQSLFFSLHNQSDWKIMRDVFCDKIVTPPEQSRVLLIAEQWREGSLTNWEYLMTLNQFAGRTYNDLMQYPVFPWVLANYNGDQLDLTDANNYRKLEKPIAVQHKENEQHYITNYTYINNSMSNPGSLILKPYHYSSHYSNSGTVLHFLVRVPPFTSYFLRYQDNNFDLPDRTFHALSTTWSLASRDSPTDVKELIPEFFSLPEMFENFERFNFGCRQSGERVEDVLLPPWCQRDPRLFVLIHRQALESELVRNHLNHWIDLIFGYKQTGEAAVEAINVFHPATYAYILESEITDPIERKAYETMVKTYGQMPRQLLKAPHPASRALSYGDSAPEVLPTVRGLRWGIYVGSPQLPKPTLGNIYKLLGAEQLISFHNTNVVYGLPSHSGVMQGADTDTFNVISWGYEDRVVRIKPLNKMIGKQRNLLYNSCFDTITACGCDPNSNQLWFGHKSGRISVYKCSSQEASNRLAKGRQSYIRGLRLSYNSAFWKIGSSKSSSATGMSTSKNLADTDSDSHSLTAGGGGAGTGGGIGGGGGGGSASVGSGGGGGSSSSIFAAGESMSRETGTAMGGGNAAGTGTPLAGTANNIGSDLHWSGPTVLVRHTDEITCISLSVEFKIAVSAGRDGIAVIWDLNDWSYVRTIVRPAEIHHSPVTLVAISPTLGDIVTVHTIPSPAGATNNSEPNSNAMRDDATNSNQPAADECFEVTEENLDDFVNVSVNPNGKSILRLHTVNARYVHHVVHEERILAVCYSYVKEGVGVNVIATAVEGGIVRLWSSWNLSFVSEIITGISNIRSITYSTHQHLVVLTKESHIQVWETNGLCGTPPKFPQIYK